MGVIEAPMLSGKVHDINKLNYPVLVSPKLDGIRCVIVNGKALSRNFKPIPNTFTRDFLEAHTINGFDGEIMIRNADFGGVSSGIMKASGEPDFYYNIFDYLGTTMTEETPYYERYNDLKSELADLYQSGTVFKERLKLVPHYVVRDPETLSAYEAQFLAEGYEGIMVRDPIGPYKFGRSGDDEGYLLKLKRFVDDEAIVVGIEPLYHNENEETQDAFGNAKRSHVASGMVAEEKLGAFKVQGKNGIVFNIGTGQGLTEAKRIQFWKDRKSLIGKMVKYKSQVVGAKTAPRFPVWIGFRSPADMDPVKTNPSRVYRLRQRSRA
jgi:DNA ligase-1